MAATPKATTKTLDFTNVKDKGIYNPVQQESGDYRAKIIGVVDQESKKDQTDMWVFALQLDGAKNAVYPYYCLLTEEHLWKVRNLIQATGKDVPKKRVKFDPNKVIGQFVGITLEDDEYDGKMKSTIQSIFPESELAEGDDDEPEDDDVDDIDDEEEEPEPPKKKAKAKAPAKKKAAPVVEEDDDDDDDDLDEDEDDEPEPPVKAKRGKASTKKTPAKKAPAKKKKAAPVEDDDDIDDDDLDELDDIEDL